MIIKEVKVDSDCELTKVFLKEVVLKCLDLGFTATKVAEVIIDNIDENFQLLITQQKIAEMAEASLKSTAKAFKILMSGDCPVLYKLGPKNGYALNEEYLPKRDGDLIDVSNVGICYIRK